jgi:succinate dehydrogenase / fumarate reductase cytochrome b subunit
MSDPPPEETPALSGRVTTPPYESRSAMAYKGRSTGLWAWLIQRFAGVATLILVLFHWRTPWARTIQLLLLGAVLLHAAIGLRVMLLDTGISPRAHKLLLWGLLAAAAGMFWLVATGRW